MPETAVVIRAYNEERHLPALFDALDSQSYRDFETVVVDSGSFDRTREIAAQSADHVVRVSPHDFTFGHSLNVGIAAADSNFVAIISAHAVPTDDTWLKNLVEPLRGERVAMVYGRQLGTDASKFSERIDFDRIFGPVARVQRPPHFFANNANSAISRELWARHRFDETLPGLEDIDWARHWMLEGYTVVYEPKAAIYHHHDEAWAQVRHRYRREAEAARYIGTLRRSDLAGEVVKEIGRSVGDAVTAARTGQLVGRLPEVARYRYERVRGAVVGAWPAPRPRTERERESIFYDSYHRAVVIRGPGEVGLEQVKAPPLRPGDVLVRVAYTGMCATDLEILDGTLGYYKNGLAKYPITPGHEFSGVIAATGPRVSEFKEGDRVVVECIQNCGVCEACRRGNAIGCADRTEVGVIRLDGGYAEYMVSPAHFVHHVPDGLGLLEACVCEPLAVVMKGLRRLQHSWGAEERPRDCAVVGAGPIGHLSARILNARGHCVTVFDRDPSRLQLFGGTDIKAGRDLAELGAFEALIEATGDPDALEPILHNSAPGASILLLGLPYARRDFSFEAIVGYDKTIVGSVGSAGEDFDEALAVLPKIDISAFVRRQFPLDQYAAALAAARERRQLKVILKVDPELPDPQPHA